MNRTLDSSMGLGDRRYCHPRVAAEQVGVRALVHTKEKVPTLCLEV